MSFQPVDREVIYYFHPDGDIYNHYTETYNLMDLNETKAQFVEKIREASTLELKNPTKIKEFYTEAILSRSKVIKASSPHPFREGLNEQDILNLHLIFADTIDQQVADLSKKPLFTRVASENFTLPLYAKVYCKIKPLLE